MGRSVLEWSELATGLRLRGDRRAPV